MITVRLNRADFEYDIHSLVKAFYPAENVQVSAEQKESKEPISFHMVTTYLEKAIQIAFYESEDTTKNPVLKREIAVDFTDRKQTKNNTK